MRPIRARRRVAGNVFFSSWPDMQGLTARFGPTAPTRQHRTSIVRTEAETDVTDLAVRVTKTNPI